MPSGARPFDLVAPKRIHVVGIGGAGMSAIAGVLARMGHVVSGSDLKPSSNLERLRGLGVEVHVGHDASHVDGVDAVTISTAIPSHNREVRAATERGVPVLRRAVRACGDDPQNLTCAYAMYNLGRSLRLAGRPAEAIPVLERRLQNPDQRATVQAELDRARAAAG